MISTAGVPWRPLAVIAAVVLGVHALALRGVPQHAPWRPGPVPVVVDLRSVVLAPVQEPAVDTAAPVVAAAAVASSAAPSRSAGKAPARTKGPDAHPAMVVPPASGVTQFAVTGQWRGASVSGSATLAWRHDRKTYEARWTLQAPPLATREQHSAGTLASHGLQPERYAERQRGEAAAHFDRARGRIVFSSNRPEAMLQPGAQDRLSLLVQLTALAAAEPARFAPGRVVALQVAGTREADEWRFSVEGSDDLALAGETLRALRLARSVRGPYDPRLELWLAPGRDYALVRLRLTPPGGDWLDVQWSGTDKR